jgi:hypothetical protein
VFLKGSGELLEHRKHALPFGAGARRLYLFVRRSAAGPASSNTLIAHYAIRRYANRRHGNMSNGATM